MRTVSDLFITLGGPAVIARILGKKPSTASEMKRRQSIPLTYWPALIAAAQEKGIELDEATLVRIHLAPVVAEGSPDQAASHAA